jgi:hypothetical protein
MEATMELEHDIDQAFQNALSSCDERKIKLFLELKQKIRFAKLIKSDFKDSDVQEVVKDTIRQKKILVKTLSAVSSLSVISEALDAFTLIKLNKRHSSGDR